MKDSAETLTARLDMRAVDASTFADAVGPFIPRMYLLACRLGSESAADDVVQEALVRAWRYRRRFDPARGSFSNWLFAIVANEARRSRGGFRLPIRVAGSRLELSADERLDVRTAVRALPSRQREAVDCHYYVGLTIDATAAVMKCSPGTVKSTLADARSNLRRLLEDRS